MAAVLGTNFFEKCYTPLGEVMDLVALVNCTVNFLLYSLMSRQFRITFRKTFHLREARKGSDASLARDKKGSPSQLPPKAEYSMVRRLERSWTYYILQNSIMHSIYLSCSLQVLWKHNDHKSSIQCDILKVLCSGSSTGSAHERRLQNKRNQLQGWTDRVIKTLDIKPGVVQRIYLNLFCDVPVISCQEENAVVIKDHSIPNLFMK